MEALASGVGFGAGVDVVAASGLAYSQYRRYTEKETEHKAYVGTVLAARAILRVFGTHWRVERTAANIAVVVPVELDGGQENSTNFPRGCNSVSCRLLQACSQPIYNLKYGLRRLYSFQYFRYKMERRKPSNEC